MDYVFDFDALQERTKDSKLVFKDIVFKRYSLFVNHNGKSFEIIINDNDSNREVYRELCGVNRIENSLKTTYDYYKGMGINVSISDNVKDKINGELLSTIRSYPKR
jgi:hypothetical protein